MNFILLALTDRNKMFKNNKEMVVIKHSLESMVFRKMLYDTFIRVSDQSI